MPFSNHPHLFRVLLVVLFNCLISISTSRVENNCYYRVTITTTDPLGLRLNDGLQIVEFFEDVEGRPRAVASSGFAGIGDQLVKVNEVDLSNLMLNEAISEIQKAQLPKTIIFQSASNKCQFSTINSTTPMDSGHISNQSDVTDYVLVSDGNADADVKFFGLVSSESKPPSCIFRELVLANPIDGCNHMIVNVSEKFVIVPEIGGCPAHQKAALIQEMGGKGVVLVQATGSKLQQVKVPSSLPNPIDIPIVMVSSTSGGRILDRLASNNRWRTHYLRYVFEKRCTSQDYTLLPTSDVKHITATGKISTAVAGYITISLVNYSISGQKHTLVFDFLKPDQLTANLPIGSSRLAMPNNYISRIACNPRDVDDYEPDYRLYYDYREVFLLWKADMACSLGDQLTALAVRGMVKGIILAVAEYPDVQKLSTPDFSTKSIEREWPSIPIVFVSISTWKAIRGTIEKLDSSVTALVEFTGKNAVLHQWNDLFQLAVPANWPTKEAGRNRLFYRMLKSYSAEANDENTKDLYQEKYEHLVASYWRAQMYYNRLENRYITDRELSGTNEVEVSAI